VLLYPEYTLRHILAALLVLFFGAGPLLPALVVGRVQSDVPACCRKDGAHRCSVRIAKKSTAEQDGNPGLRALCPFMSYGAPSAAGPQSFVSPSAAELGVDRRFEHAIVADTPREKPRLARCIFQPKRDGRMCWQEHDLSPANRVAFVDAHGSFEFGATAFGKCKLYGGLILRGAEPNKHAPLSHRVQVRAIYGTASKVPVVRVDNPWLRPVTVYVPN
jgi:hypothetical protein